MCFNAICLPAMQEGSAYAPLPQPCIHDCVHVVDGCCTFARQYSWSAFARLRVLHLTCGNGGKGGGGQVRQNQLCVKRRTDDMKSIRCESAEAGTRACSGETMLREIAFHVTGRPQTHRFQQNTCFRSFLSRPYPGRLCFFVAEKDPPKRLKANFDDGRGALVCSMRATGCRGVHLRRFTSAANDYPQRCRRESAGVYLAGAARLTGRLPREHREFSGERHRDGGDVRCWHNRLWYGGGGDWCRGDGRHSRDGRPKRASEYGPACESGCGCVCRAWSGVHFQRCRSGLCPVPARPGAQC